MLIFFITFCYIYVLISDYIKDKKHSNATYNVIYFSILCISFLLNIYVSYISN